MSVQKWFLLTKKMAENSNVSVEIKIVLMVV